MRSMWTKGLAAALGLVAAAHAQNAPIATIGRPVAATIGRPVALPNGWRPAAQLDGPVKPVSYNRPLVRGVSPDPTPGKPVPTGPGTDPGALGMFGWRRPEEPTPAPAFLAPPALSPVVTVGGQGTSVLPAPTAVPLPTGAPSLGGPAASVPVTSGPVSSAPGHPGAVVTPAGPMYGGAVVTPAGPMYGGAVVAPAGPVVGVPTGDCDGNIGSPVACPGGVCAGLGVAAAGGADPFSNRFYLGAEYLLWRVKGDDTPPLVTATGPGGNAAVGVAGTSVLYGGGGVNDGPRSGGRLTAGWWFDDQRCLGLEVSGFFLSQEVTHFAAGGNEFGNVVGRPFTNIEGGVAVPSFELVSGTDFTGRALQGGVDVRQTSSLWGFEVNLKRNILSGPSYNLDCLVGYRQLGLDETLSINENLVVVNDIGAMPFPPGTGITVQDRFLTRNRFYGGQVGLAGEVWLYERLSLGGSFKLGLGYTNAGTTIDGFSTATVNGETRGAPGGLLAQGNTVGFYTRDNFSVVPELGFTLGYHLTDWMRLSVGYNFLYWSNVARAGEQVPTNVNFANAFGATPTPPLTDPVNRLNNFWAHGITAGLEFRF